MTKTNLLSNHNFKTKLLNQKQLNKFLKNCKSINILDITRNKNKSIKIEYKHNDITYLLAEIIDKYLDNNFIDMMWKRKKEFSHNRYKISYDKNRIKFI